MDGLCASYSYITQCLTCSSGCWGFVWQMRAFPVVIVVMASLFSLTEVLFIYFFFLSGPKAVKSLFSVEAGIWQTFQVIQPSRSVWFICLDGDYGQQNSRVKNCISWYGVFHQIYVILGTKMPVWSIQISDCLLLNFIPYGINNLVN